MCRRLLANPVIEAYDDRAQRAGLATVDVSARVGVVLFPGTNCELDVAWAVEQLGGDAEMLWHAEAELRGVDAVVVPGGFAHGDYLRTGAIARFSPVMDAVGRVRGGRRPGRRHLQRLPGAHRSRLAARRAAEERRAHLPVRDRRAPGRDHRSVLTGLAAPGDVLRIPINHFEGNYVCDETTLPPPPRRRPHRAALRRQPQRQPRRHRRRSATRAATSSGSCRTPSAPATPLLGSADGVVLLRSLLAAPPRAPRRLQLPREIPAFFSVRRPSTPSSRHAAYEMPLRSAYLPCHLHEVGLERR